MEIKFKNVTFSSKIGLKDRDYVSYFYSKKQGQFLIFPIFSTSKPNVSYKPVSYKSNLRVSVLLENMGLSKIKPVKNCLRNPPPGPPIQKNQYMCATDQVHPKNPHV